MPNFHDYLPDVAALDAAAAIVYDGMLPTPQHSWPLLNAALGTEAWVKHENHTAIGAFKLRGNLVYLARLRERLPEVRRVLATTRGNHGQAVAFAARKHSMHATIVVPHGNSVEKNAAMRAFGAELIEHGHEYADTQAHAAMLEARDSLHRIPALHPDLVAGVASYWLELLRAQPSLEVLLVPIGQGSGIAAAIAAKRALNHSARIIGVVSQHAPAYQLSFRARRAIESPVLTQLADGVACRAPHPDSLALVLEFVDDVLAVSDAEVASAMRLLYRCTHNVAEGAGALALAAAMQQRDSSLIKGRCIGLPLTGGNVDTSVFAGVLMGGDGPGAQP